MGKYQSNSRRQAAVPRNQVPALVRGIGCITMVIVPVLSYGIAAYWIKEGLPGSALIPPSLLGPPNIPAFFFSSPALGPIATFLRSQNNLAANLLFAVVATMIIGGFMAVVSGYISAMFGPSRYGPTDVPPPRVKTKKYTR
jgi:ABC-type antimicrobial peptide transport system permease subunit